jgi:hypothetical protein
MDYQTYKLTPHFHIEVADSPRGFSLSDYDKTRIEMVWSEENSARPSKLFNGQLLNFVSLENEILRGEFVDYKFYIAQLRDPGLEPLLNIAPVSISALTFAGDKLLVGRRSGDVTQYKNLFECVPSGGIDPAAVRDQKVDLQEQFSRELWEETHISVTEIKRILPFQLVQDFSTHHYEICATIEVNYMVVHEERKPTEEYSEFIWVPRSEIKNFLKQHASEFVPFSLHLIEHYKNR